MGISGLATAARLSAAGWSTTLIERSPERRRGGYFVALFGAGRIAAERLGLLERLHDRQSTAPGYAIDRTGRKVLRPTYGDLPGNPWLMLRGDVEAAAYAGLPPDVDVRYATVPIAIAEDGDEVHVALHDTIDDTVTNAVFDLVVACDGLRSTVRRLAFGPHESYLTRLDYMVAAYEYPDGEVAGLGPNENAILQEPGRALWVIAFEDHNPTIMISYRTDDVDAEFTQPPGQRLRQAFGPGDLGVTLGAAIAAVEALPRSEVLFDSAEQVHMKTWRNGRVVLLGDSAWCTTLYSGMGVSAGLVGAEMLGAMLELHDHNVVAALDDWESALRPYIDDYQRAGRDQRKIFVPNGGWELGVQRAMPLLSKLPHANVLLQKLRPNTGAAVSADVVAIELASRV